MTIVTIDRSRPFNPAEFIGPGWTTEEQDEGSLLLTEIDLTKVRLETCLNSGEQYIKGEEKLRRLKLAGHIRLDAKVFQTLWENQELVPESWKEEKNRRTTSIFFVGTILLSPYGYRCVPYLYWRGAGWDWDRYSLGRVWNANNPSAVLA